MEITRRFVTRSWNIQASEVISEEGGASPIFALNSIIYQFILTSIFPNAKVPQKISADYTKYRWPGGQKWIISGRHV
jgi:hypothetical protein